ncbi:PAS domain S-box protein [Ferrovibrio sp.]|uniref:PAS domain S-box protein n=1 Tax=Ferrovibrio sp. TaxID=1917215 RepID=UPI0025C51A20|nr:PAS domain S-box protein [Ferrovibrio sp.]MBX3454536.1 PAS domain S-box protein [Ferrovibrio sp.]
MTANTADTDPQGHDALAHEIKRARPLLAAALDAVIVADLRGKVLEFNPAAERMFGLARDAALGRGVGELLVPQHLRAAHDEGIKRHMAGEPPRLLGRRIETEALHADGRRFPVELTVTEIERGGVRFLTAYLRDITDRKTAEAALRRSEARYSLAVRGSEDGIFEWDLESNSTYYSERLERIAGRSKRDLGPNLNAWQAFVHDDDKEIVRNAIRAMLQGDSDITMLEFRILRPDGSERWLRATAAIERDDLGRALRIAGSLGDITERKRSEAEIARQREALYQSEKLSAQGSLLASVAHELNNPLAIVLGQAQLLRDAVHNASQKTGQNTGQNTATTHAASQASAGLAERANRIAQAAERCGRIVRGFLALARQRRPEAASETAKPVYVETLLDEALSLLDYGLRSAGISLQRAQLDPLPALRGDADQLGQVLSNLLVNAQQALLERPEPRRLSVQTMLSLDRRWAEIVVADNGPGVKPELRRRIFEPFFTTKPEGSGTGIGLSVSLGIVEAHGGSLTVEDNQGGGACFTLRLPLPEHADEAAPEPIAAPESAAFAALPAGARLLVVDDDPEVAELLREILNQAGYGVDLARHGAEALERIATTEYAAILSDMRMPVLDGRGLLLRLQAERPELAQRLIFVSGDTLNLTGQAGNGEDRPVLEKPFNRQAVLNALAALRRG